MKSKNEILDEFGFLIARKVFDNQYSFILNNTLDLAQTEGYKNLFNDMSTIQKKEIEFYTKEILKGAIFDFLNIFEENDHFKIIYENDGQKANLVDISEMLKAEPIIENGWISRFSQEIKGDEID